METREAVQRLILVEPKRVYDLHESAINVVVPDRGRCGCGRAGGCGSRGPGGRCSACSRVAATRVRWASGCACAAYPRAGPGAFRCEVPRHFAEVPRHCLTRVLRASRLCVPPTAPMGMAPRSRVAARAGRGVHPHPDHFLGSGRSNVALPCRGCRQPADITNTKLHGSFADRPRPISREFSCTHFVTDALRRPRPRVIACNRSIL